MLSVSAPPPDWLIRLPWLPWRCTPQARFLGTASIVVCFLLLWDWRLVSGWRHPAGRAATILGCSSHWRSGGGGTLAGSVFRTFVGSDHTAFWPTVLVLLTERARQQRFVIFSTLWMPCEAYGFWRVRLRSVVPPALGQRRLGPVVVGLWALDWFRFGPRVLAVPWRWSVSGLPRACSSEACGQNRWTVVWFSTCADQPSQDLRAGWPAGDGS